MKEEDPEGHVQSWTAPYALVSTPNSAYMDFGYMDFFGDFSVICTFSLINCSIWTFSAGTNVVTSGENCIVEDSDKVDCGFPGINEKSCTEDRGCCWLDDSEFPGRSAAIPW